MYAVLALGMTSFMFHRYGLSALGENLLSVIYGALFLSTFLTGVVAVLFSSWKLRTKMRRFLLELVSVTGVLSIILASVVYVQVGRQAFIDDTLWYLYISLVMSPIIYLVWERMQKEKKKR